MVKQLVRMLLVTCGCASIGLVGLACVDTPEARGPWHGWSTLQLKAKSVPLLRGKVELRVSEDGHGKWLETTTSARFFGATIARSETITLLDPVTGRTREYRSYSRKKGRHYVFGKTGYTVDKLRRSKNEDEPWVVKTSKAFDYPGTEEGRAASRLFDYYGMLLNLDDLGLDAPGDEVEVQIATSDGPEAYRIRVNEIRDGARAFTDLRTGKKTELPARELRLTVSPTDPESEEGFLNMEGETEIWVEAGSKTLLEIVGKVPNVPGKVRLVLSAMG